MIVESRNMVTVSRMIDQITGFVLKQIDYKENSVILTVLTREYGKIAFLAKGVRKITSKSAGNVIPYTKVSFQFDYRQDRTMFQMRSTKVENLYKNIHADLIGTVAAGIITDVADALNYEGSDLALAVETFDLLDKCFDMLNQKKRSDIIIALFLSRMMDNAGIAPDVDECVVCGSQMVNSISIHEGGFLCSNCASTHHSIMLPVNQLKQFRLLCKASPKHYELIENSLDNCVEDCEILISFLQQFAGIQVKSFKLFKELFTLNDNA